MVRPGPADCPKRVIIEEANRLTVTVRRSTVAILIVTKRGQPPDICVRLITQRSVSHDLLLLWLARFETSGRAFLFLSLSSFREFLKEFLDDQFGCRID